MFCPDCGTDNSRNQKYCVRCGANLIVVEQARSIIQEVSVGQPAEHINPTTVLKTAGVISVLGFLFVAVATMVLAIATEDRSGPPVGLFFAFAGFTALVLIVRRLLRLIDKTPSKAKVWADKIIEKKAAAIPATQTRSLSDTTDTAYYSVTEDRTRQFEKQ